MGKMFKKLCEWEVIEGNKREDFILMAWKKESYDAGWRRVVCDNKINVRESESTHYWGKSEMISWIDEMNKKLKRQSRAKKINSLDMTQSVTLTSKLKS